MDSKFIDTISAGYSFKSDAIDLGVAMLNGETTSDVIVRLPLSTLNRHGLIAGATGTGKTKTLQMLAEQLSYYSVPVLMMDIKGDLSGIAMPGTKNDRIKERIEKTALEWLPQGYPVEFYSLTGENGARLRATLVEFGPVLLSKIIGLNDTQSGVVAVIFKYCDDNGLPLLDLKDFIQVLQYAMNDGKELLDATYGKISSTTIGTIMRKVVELQQQGADTFFGEPSFDVNDLCRLDEHGRGVISVVRLADIQDRPKLFSTFMLQLLAEIYATFPEKGDVEQPELVFFIDEAHLVFQEASNTLLEQIETIIKLIRSKGVGIFFVTQNPADIPNNVLSQLGLKIQHALRAFTAKDRKDIKLVAQNYPLTDFYKVEDQLTQLGIGEAFVTALNEKGIPTPLVQTMLRAPQSRMDVLTDAEIAAITSSSDCYKKYSQDIDRESAYEILSEKLKQEPTDKSAKTTQKEEKSVFEKVLENPVAKQVGRSVVRELTRGLLGALGLGGKKKSGWF